MKIHLLSRKSAVSFVKPVTPALCLPRVSLLREKNNRLPTSADLLATPVVTDNCY